MINCTMILKTITLIYSVLIVCTIAQIQHCNDTSDIVAQNENDWKIIRSLSPSLGTSLRSEEGIGNLFSIIHNTEIPVDIVILIENSIQVGLSNFYLRQRKLVEDLLRYHLVLDPSRVRLALVTFAQDVYVVYYGFNVHQISAQLLLGAGGPWQSVVFDIQHRGAIDIRKAFIRVADLLRTSSGVSNPQQVILTFSTGNFDPGEIPEGLIDSLKRTNVQLFSVDTGLTDSNGCLPQVSDLASRSSQCVTSRQWMNEMWTNADNPGSVCDGYNISAQCEHGGWCFAPDNGLFPTCWCPWGYTNDRCQDEEDECVFNVCGGSHGTCQDGVATFNCLCQEEYCGCYCHDACQDDGLADWVLILIGFVAAAFIVIPGVIVRVIWRRVHPRNPEGQQPQPQATIDNGNQYETMTTYVEMQQRIPTREPSRKFTPPPPRRDYPATPDADPSISTYTPTPPQSLPDHAQVMFEDSLIYDAVVTQCMDEWKMYICRLLSSKILDQLFISHRTMPFKSQYIASEGDFVLTQDEQDTLLSNLDYRVPTLNISFQFREKDYAIKEYLPNLYVAVQPSEDLVLCVARNEQYFVVALRSNSSRKSQGICQRNVQHILDRLHI